ncbi:wnt inhibitory factor 1-like [Lingula anatina]|uniref:Wnt inhibitory factor 1-like n=1 Tax=Lingula anatina TaxID=7574 RepID=A0A1S3HKB1_LINAN|nr:wnt inhibitory factor 1-like [Lingula anatina]|eukprot:XP_013385434.1 wnt inhibitory factor 1-like [Lingula anatina]
MIGLVFLLCLSMVYGGTEARVRRFDRQRSGQHLSDQTSGQHSRQLNLYIDEEQVEQYVGIPLQIFIIEAGTVVPFLKMPEFADHFPVIPPEIDMVNLTWEAKNGKYTYWFEVLSSSRQSIMYNPLLSIPAVGYVPAETTVFQIAIPCTGRGRGIATVRIVLHVMDVHNRPIPGSPIEVRLQKQCNSFRDEKPKCDERCENGGICDGQGQCQCPTGYSGKKCELVDCNPGCQNKGLCVSPNVCKCVSGYEGKRCEIKMCTEPCLNGGSCVGPSKCVCQSGFYGERCQHSRCLYPCSHGGTCAGKDVCSCPSGYTGRFCELPVCQRGCGPHGMCVDVDICMCEFGWYGRYCNKNVYNRRNSRREKRRRSRDYS